MLYIVYIAQLTINFSKFDCHRSWFKPSYLANFHMHYAVWIKYCKDWFDSLIFECIFFFDPMLIVIVQKAMNQIRKSVQTRPELIVTRLKPKVDRGWIKVRNHALFVDFLGFGILSALLSLTINCQCKLWSTTLNTTFFTEYCVQILAPNS